jgi:small neutral amino acid transporter SnatA (MarC family)
VLLAFFFLGNYVMQLLGLDQATISVSGGIVLFLIAIRMIFSGEAAAAKDPPLGERGLLAMERLMGMLLVMVAVQMFMNGESNFS